MDASGRLTRAEWAAMRNARFRRGRLKPPLKLVLQGNNELPVTMVFDAPVWFEFDDFDVNWGDGTTAVFEWSDVDQEWSISGDAPRAEEGTGTLTQGANTNPFKWMGGSP